jgi:LPXTG-site transpeptidase (sortase) family protein
MKLLSKLFISVGIIFYILGIYNIWLVKNPSRLSFSNYSYADNSKKESVSPPVRITIHNLNIDLPVFPSRIVQNEWETTQSGASYLKSSPIPGEPGNSIIYAHNWASLFGNLIDITPGDQITIEYQDKSKKTFEVKYTSVVTPDTSSILSPTKDKRITLYTCTGFMDSHRFVAVAVLKDK